MTHPTNEAAEMDPFGDRISIVQDPPAACRCGHRTHEPGQCKARYYVTFELGEPGEPCLCGAAPSLLQERDRLTPEGLFRVPFDRDSRLFPLAADHWTEEQFDAFFEGIVAGIAVVQGRYENPDEWRRSSEKAARLAATSTATEEPTDD